MPRLSNWFDTYVIAIDMGTTAAELVNELIEAKNQSELNRVTSRWLRYPTVIDEMGYVAMRESAVELLFKVIPGARKEPR